MALTEEFPVLFEQLIALIPDGSLRQPPLRLSLSTHFALKYAKDCV